MKCLRSLSLEDGRVYNIPYIEMNSTVDVWMPVSLQERFRKLIEADEHLRKWATVPKVVPELLSKEVRA